VGAGGDFRHDATVRLMRSILPDHGLGQNLPIGGDERGRAVVAG